MLNTPVQSPINLSNAKNEPDPYPLNVIKSERSFSFKSHNKNLGE